VGGFGYRFAMICVVIGLLHLVKCPWLAPH